MTLLQYILALLCAEACWSMGPWVMNCPYLSEQKAMSRVWCKQTESDCCSGIVFNSNTSELEGGAVMVQQDSQAFSLKVLQLSQGEGVYWCGLLSHDNIIIKLAEEGMYHDSVWWILRWILLAVLLTVTPAMHLCSRIKTSWGSAGMSAQSTCTIHHFDH